MASEDFLLEILKRLQSDNDDFRRRFDGLETHLSAHDDFFRGIMTLLGGMNGDIGQLNRRVDRIERRLGLIEG
ncbi:MAG: hypothetical protein JOZ90_04005 [Alphaproteobacteria bacterium]|nr:hypothetical protein [Alphaproteobacteria bacterium]MBV9373155.1 hypothetical protein [Alphaproteobacteria bacterium]MBV9900244.1 hypothetical protein [Alphaproteobacteria bacterium]